MRIQKKFQVNRRTCRDGSSDYIASISPPAEMAASWRCELLIKNLTSPVEHVSLV